MQNDLSGIEAKIKRIEADLQKNHKTINLIKETVREIAKGNSDGIKQLQEALQLDLQVQMLVSFCIFRPSATKLGQPHRVMCVSSLWTLPAGLTPH